MSKQIPIASVAFLRKWQLAHRKLTGKTHNIRHASMARILALTDMTPEQVAVVTAHHARVDEALALVTLPPREHQRGACPQVTYREYAQKLLDGGHAYRCFCTDDERKARRKTLSAAYDRHCRAMSRDEVAARIAAGDKHVVRFASPTEGKTKFCDGVYGDVVIDNETLDDAVIVKADGKASHILTNVVDDHLIGVSHAIRYEHWIINVPVQIHLYAALGWQAPKFSHVKTETLADVIASDVRPHLFADALMCEALANGKPMIIGDSPSRDDIVEAEANGLLYREIDAQIDAAQQRVAQTLALLSPKDTMVHIFKALRSPNVLNALADGKTTTTPSRKRRKP